MNPDNQKKAIYNYVLDMLRSGSYPAGSALPSGKELSEKFGLSRYHVHEALAEFYRINLIESRKKGGITILRELEGYEERFLSAALSDKILIINHMPSCLPWSAVHINENLFSALYPPLEDAGLKVVFEEISLTDDMNVSIAEVEKFIEKHRPRAVVVFSGGRMFENFEEVYSLRHRNIVVFTRSGLLSASSLWSCIGIANTADGVTAAETAFANGAEQLIYCYKSSLHVQYWQLERRQGVQHCLRLRQNGQVFVNDYHVSQSFPFTQPQPETCLIAHNDELAAELIDAGRVYGLEPGKDYKIIGFGDDPRFQSYGLTTLRPDFIRIGAALAEAVLDTCRFSGKGVICSKLIPSVLIRRKTL